MPLHIEAIPAFETNYIWAIHDGQHCAIVDPGQSAGVLEFLAERALKLSALLLTHHHADHIGGVADILARHPAPVWGPVDARMPQVNHPLGEGDRAEIPELGLSFEVLETPGHTRSHIVFHDQYRLLAGDTLFSAGCGRLFEGTPEQMQRSLDKLDPLGDDIQVYCAHEYTRDNCRFALAVEPDNPTLQEWAAEVDRRRKDDRITLPVRLGQERAVNPFLRTRKPAVIEAANQREPGTGDDPAAVFGVIRRWKDGFG